jgi:hypothetical protein
LVVTGEYGASEVVELPLAVQTAVPLSEPLGVISALFDDVLPVAVGARHAIGPAELPHDLKAFFVVQELN